MVWSAPVAPRSHPRRGEPGPCPVSRRVGRAVLVRAQWRCSGLLVRRSIADGELAYFTTWCPAGTPIETLVAVEGRRWATEDAFETAKTELGLDHNETRSRHGWHRHVSLVTLAFAVLAVARHRANAAAEQTPPRVGRAARRSSGGPSRKSGASRPASASAAFARHSSSPGRPGAVPTRRARNAPT